MVNGIGPGAMRIRPEPGEAGIAKAEGSAAGPAGIPAFAPPGTPGCAGGTARAAAALGRVLQTGEDEGPTLAQIAGMDMATLVLATMTLGLRSGASLGRLHAEAIRQRAGEREALAARDLAVSQHQVAEAARAAAEARTAGILSVLFDWVVAAIEVASGIGKLLIGDWPGAGADLAAGACGFVKAVAGTAALLDPAHEREWQSVADVAGRVQLGFEILGGCVSAIQIGRAVMAVRGVVRGTERALQGAAGEALAAAARQGDPVLVRSVVSGTASEVAGSVAGQVARRLDRIVHVLPEAAASHLGARLVTQGGSQRILAAFSEAGIRELVGKVLAGTVRTAMKEGAHITAEALCRDGVRALKMALLSRVATSLMTPLAVVRGLGEGSRQLSGAVLALQGADDARVLARLATDRDALDLARQWCTTLLAAEQSALQSDALAATRLQQGGMQSLSHLMQVRLQGLTSMV